MRTSTACSTRSWRPEPGNRDGGRTARLRKLRFLASFFIGLVLSSCATAPGPPGPPLLVEIKSVETEAVDQFRVRFTFRTAVSNRGPQRLKDISLSWALELGGRACNSGSLGEGIALDPGQGVEARCAFVVDTREPAMRPDRAELPWRMEAQARTGGAAGAMLLGSGRAEGTFPLVQEPGLAIQSITLVRHELVNVLLELVLEVSNPNAFPVNFENASYQFYGEGRKWSNGAMDRPVGIPARGTAEVRLPIVLNFTEAGRDLFNLVAALKVVRYGLTGEARITTPVPFLPEFRMSFDKSGSTQVERTLSDR